jgi:hypothetical protein
MYPQYNNNMIFKKRIKGNKKHGHAGMSLAC